MHDMTLPKNSRVSPRRRACVTGFTEVDHDWSDTRAGVCPRVHPARLSDVYLISAGGIRIWKCLQLAPVCLFDGYV